MGFFAELSKTFLALLFAGVIISWVSYRFLKSERWHKTADSFCVNMEKFITDYFDDSKKQQLVRMKFYAYLESFMIFVDKSPFANKNPEILQHWKRLMDLDWDSEMEEKERITQARITQALASVAMLRRLLAK